MAPETPERLTKWMLPMEDSHLSLDHPVQEDLAWAADEIARLRKALCPFSQEFEAWAAGGVTSGLVDIKAPEDDGCDVAHFTVEDLARAHELCTKHE